jgi:AAA domain-containing protein
LPRGAVGFWQIRAIQSALTASGQTGLKVGTVDKFQGREAPVVIYSMATSSADQAPRGMEFLYDLHRLNVATSRAQALAIIVASPDLIRVSCRTPQQMILANALCQAWETAAADAMLLRRHGQPRTFRIGRGVGSEAGVKGLCRIRLNAWSDPLNSLR